jgi:uncharacterized membrane protein YfhO
MLNLTLDDITPHTKLLAISLAFVLGYTICQLNIRALLIILILIIVILLSGMLLDDTQNEKHQDEPTFEYDDNNTFENKEGQTIQT